MTKKIWIVVMILFLSFLVASNWHRIPTTALEKTKPPEIERPIVIGYSNWAGWWPWAIAESEGLFAKHNANVELKWYDNYSQSMEDLAAGLIDGNCQTLNDTISFAADAVKGEVVVLVNDNSAGNDKIIAADGIDNIKELKNQQIVIEAGVVDDFLLTLALEAEGMSRNDVHIIDLETGAATEAFAAGHADAVGAFPPFWLTALKREGSTEIASSKDFPGAIPDLLVVTEELIEQKPEQVQALIDTWFDLLDFMAEDPTQAERIMAKRAGVNFEEFQLFKVGTKIFNLAENLEAFTDGRNMKHMPYAAGKMSDFLLNNLKSIDKMPKSSQLFEQKFVKAYSKKAESYKLTAFN